VLAGCARLIALFAVQRKAKGIKQAEPELRMPELASARDVPLEPFHAIGKFLYNKRGEEGSEARCRHHHR
jgi:hypothetical protein